MRTTRFIEKGRRKRRRCHPKNLMVLVLYCVNIVLERKQIVLSFDLVLHHHERCSSSLLSLGQRHSFVHSAHALIGSVQVAAPLPHSDQKQVHKCDLLILQSFLLSRLQRTREQCLPCPRVGQRSGLEGTLRQLN